MKIIRLKSSRRSFIWNYIIGVFLLIYLSFSLHLTSLSPALTFVLIILIFTFFLEPELEIIYRTYIIEEDSISRVDGVISKKKITIPFQSIADQKLEKGLMGRLLNFGNVIVRGFKDEIKMKGIKNPEKVYKIVEEKIRGVKNK